MQIHLNKTSLLILGLTSLALSRANFFLIKDPEGPNLLVVAGFAAILFVLSLAVSSFTPAKKLLPVVLIEIVIAAAFHFLLLL